MGDLKRFFEEEVLPELTIELYEDRGVEFKLRGRKEWRGACPLHGGSGANFCVNVETLHWSCKSVCGKGGDVLAFLNDGEPPRGKRFVECVQEAADIAGVPMPGRQHSYVSHSPKRVYKPADVRKAAADPIQTLSGVQHYWESCERVDECPEAIAWLADQGFPEDAAGKISDRKLARIVPRGMGTAWDVCCGKRWATHYRLVVPLYDHEGHLRSLKARSLRPGVSPKSASPKGYSCKGLVMADSFGLQLLKDGKKPGWWSAEHPLQAVICEGEKDYLAWSTRLGDADEYAPAVFGHIAGGWKEEHAGRLDPEMQILVCVDHDDAGEKYANEIMSTFKAGQRCFRARSSSHG